MADSPISIILDQNGNYITHTQKGDQNSLDVNITPSVQGSKLIYETMTIDQALTSGAYINIYEDVVTSTEKMLWVKCIFDNNNINIKLTVDTNVILNDLKLQDLYADYYLDTAHPGIIELDFVRTERQGRILVLAFQNGLEYSTSFKIEAKANSTGMNLTRGIVIRSER